MMDEMIIENITHVLSERKKAALITITETKGSTPRKAGSKMLVLEDGSVIGTIGGGCAEAEAKINALIAIDEQKSRVFEVSMLGDTAANEGMVCGGIMKVFIHYIG